MKVARHEKIIELIHQYDIDTQEELASRLNEAGFKVTQATVSRDIRALKLTKVAGKDGKSRYAIINNESGSLGENMLFLNIGKLLYQSIINSFPHSHMLKGFRQKLIEIPVDQVKFVHKIPIESLPRNTTILCNLFYCDVIYRHRFHTFLH